MILQPNQLDTTRAGDFDHNAGFSAVDGMIAVKESVGRMTELRRNGVPLTFVLDRARALTVSGSGGSHTRDKDPFGVLSGGSTPRLFMESDASKFLHDAPSADKALDASRMDPARNPALRLAQKSVFSPRNHERSMAAVQHAQNMVNQQIISNGHLLKMSQQLGALTEALLLR